MVALKEIHHRVAHSGKKALIALTSSLSIMKISQSVQSCEPKKLHEPCSVKAGEQFLQVEEVEEISARKPGIIPKMWTPEEDEILRNAVERHGEKNWREIAQELPQRTHLQCLQRWKKALRPGLVKGHWSKEEDDYLIELMEKFWEQENGNWNWTKISEYIPGRNPKQCRERWHLNLDPSINRGPWTDEEDEKLLRLHDELNGRWSLIAKEMIGRTENSVKTRFHSLQRRQVRVRGWVKEEDDLFVRGLLTYGRNYTLCARLLPGRSRGQLKKRFPTLLQMRANLHSQVKEVEAKIEQGYVPVPIHEVLRALQEERKQKKKQQQIKQENEVDYTQESQVYGDSRYEQQNLAALANTYNYQSQSKYDEKQPQDRFMWMDEIIDQMTEPIVSGRLPRTNSTGVIQGIIEENEASNGHFNFGSSQHGLNDNIDAFDLSRSKDANFSALDKVISIMDDLEETSCISEAQTLDWYQPVQNAKASDKYSSNLNTRNGFSSTLFEDDKSDLYYDHRGEKRSFAPFCNSQFGGNTWSRLPTIRSGGDFPVL